MVSDRVQELKAQLDAVVLGSRFIDECAPEQRALRDEAVGSFVAAGAQLLDAARPFVWEYYRRTAGEFTAAERAAYGIPDIPESADIWEQVTFTQQASWILGDRPLMPGSWYLSFEGNVSWEPEHGLQLVYEDGHLCKVGPYDGHVTVAHAYGDPALLGVVFH